MKAVITPAPLKGSVSAPASKSMAHRALICAALADKPTKISCSTTSVDIEATAQCLR
ncbi:MAG: 3-phosphoshikimate 1-carboxyvinyltransferase, partial [Clostridia bacterium]|nr:3-phosphoshikimate 1-carboxyvinyltransferase [Clostridia bacterium]